MVKRSHTLYLFKLELVDWISYEKSFSDIIKMNQTLLQANANWEDHLINICERNVAYLGIRKLNLSGIKCLASHKTTGKKYNVLDITDAYVLTLYHYKPKTAFWGAILTNLPQWVLVNLMSPILRRMKNKVSHTNENYTSALYKIKSFARKKLID